MTASILSPASPRGHRVRELVVAYRSLRDSDGRVVDAAGQERVRDLVQQAYAEYEETATEAAS
jgi:hypothetical protein